jgi:hypothetical protein
LRDVNVGNDSASLLRLGFDENAFLDAGAKVGRKLRPKLV